MQKGEKMFPKLSYKNRRLDRTVWNHNTMPFPVTLDPLECVSMLDMLMVPTVITFETN